MGLHHARDIRSQAPPSSLTCIEKIGEPWDEASGLVSIVDMHINLPTRTEKRYSGKLSRYTIHGSYFYSSQVNHQNGKINIKIPAIN